MKNSETYSELYVYLRGTSSTGMQSVPALALANEGDQSLQSMYLAITALIKQGSGTYLLINPMPPKKDDKKKAGEETATEDGAERELVEKELVIGYLKSKLGRYQDFGDRLQVENVKLNEELETQKLNLRDINEFLTNELKARSLTTSAMEAKVVELYHLLDDLNKSHEEALNKLRKEKDKTIDGLEVQIKDYEKKAKSMQEFMERRDTLESELATLKETLQKKIKDYEQELTDMDRQHIQDREKWKRETAQKIKETKIQMMKLTDNQLEMTTKRTIMENEQMSIELAYQSRQTEKLLSKNNVLVDENGDLRRQLELSKQTEEELAKRNNVYQKTIKSLLSKLKEQGMQQEESSSIVTDLETHVSDVEGQLKLSQLQVEELLHQLQQTKSKLSDRNAMIEVWSARHNQATQFLMTCLEDVKDKIVTLEKPSSAGFQGSSNSAFGLPEPPLPEVAVLPGRLDDLSLEQRERVLSHLLERLHAFTKAQQLEAAAGAPSSSIQSHAQTNVFSRGSLGMGPAAVPVGSTVSLPRIPAFPRRNYPATIPISQSVVAAAQDAASHSLMGIASSNGNGNGRSALSVTVGGRGGNGLLPVIESDQEQSPNGDDDLGIPPVDDLLTKVMSDVRPWGKRSQEMNLTTSKHGVFLKKGGRAAR
ncbi:hypothetical protein CEUSTIGMA_g7412.t1 [Chlamydomonas eustigma]|uniref:Cilia- and flagella-associated protein 157 n=1 Tax=Chlamydomonas eustigma TaxID=1157962 RepID=A0A250XA32_9CHLO|nr:hypothetical protein CEUSTIGMA_g7412.t1 [Chlamydomonas eustigma]|eukprot:GAX79973.1 hypothetical protein CEUSTIGMA_g7412.t1 [Chlamydomonas eustigma]